MESEPQPSESGRCSALNIRDERCGRRAVRGAYCLTHSGEQNMRELGRRGGLVSKTDRLQADPGLELRDAARRELQALLSSDDQRVRLMAAKSIASYAPTRVPAEEAEHLARRTETTAAPVGLGEIVRLAVELGAVEAERGGAVIVYGQRVQHIEPPRQRVEPAPPSGASPPSAIKNSNAPTDTPTGVYADDPSKRFMA